MTADQASGPDVHRVYLALLLAVLDGPGAPR